MHTKRKYSKFIIALKFNFWKSVRFGSIHLPKTTLSLSHAAYSFNIELCETNDHTLRHCLSSLTALCREV